MLKSYFKDLFNRFKKHSLFTKIFFITLIVFEIFLLVICLVKTDYEVITPGYLEEVTNTINVGSDNESGHVLTVSVVTFEKVPIIQYWLGKKEDKFVTEIPDESVYTTSELNTYSIISKKMAITHSIIVAYEAANKKDSTVTLVKEFRGYIIALLRNKDTDLQTYDIITKLNDIELTTENTINKVFTNICSDNNLKFDDTINVTFLRYNNDSKEYVELVRSIKLIEVNGSLALGVSVMEYYDVNGTNSNPSFSTKYNEFWDASGGSGGAMMTLSIYNSLLSTDVTHGLIIAGTGTISLNGSIGAIGCIEQKTIKAYIASVDIFFVDNGDKDADGLTDYEKALKTCEKYGYDSDFIVGVKTFDDMISYLEGLSE